jgi:flagellar operon protein
MIMAAMSITGIKPGSPSPGASPARPPRGRDTQFAAILADRLQSRSISLSMHAADRLARRGLVIDEHAADQINEAFDLAEQKGSKNALFLLDDLAVVAAVPSRSIVTALDANGLANGVFTHIDSAVVLHRNETENQTLMDNFGESRTSPEEAFPGTGGQIP